MARMHISRVIAGPLTKFAVPFAIFLVRRPGMGSSELIPISTSVQSEPASFARTVIPLLPAAMAWAMRTVTSWGAEATRSS